MAEQRSTWRLAHEASINLTQRAARRLVINLAVLGAMLFISAGSLRFWQGWLFLSVMAGSWTFFFLHFLKHDPQLLERRLQAKEKELSQKWFQKLFSTCLFLGFILCGLDFRFGWSRTWLGPVPVALVIAGQIVAAVGYCFVFWVMKTNSFASSTIQVEQGQPVIQTGPYAIVRHPMYLGMATSALAIPFALASYVALPVFALLIPTLIFRLLHEERSLNRDLPGYREYCERTRSRLLPFVW